MARRTIVGGGCCLSLMGRGLAPCALLLLGLAAPVQAARLGLEPLMGDGAAGRPVQLSGVGFEPNETYAVTFGGYAPIPASVSSDGAGTIAAAGLSLSALPAGFHDVVLASGTRTFTFAGAYRVWRNICVSPNAGDGHPGMTPATDPSIPAGGWCGMVLRVEGWGFAAGATIPANSITVGGADTIHPAIPVDASGRLPATTVIVDSALSYGGKDIVIDDGEAVTFTNVYQVERCIDLSPTAGSRDAGTEIGIEGWGFADGILPADSVLLGSVTTTHPAVNIVDGNFSVAVITDSKSPLAALDIDLGQEVFASAYLAIAAPHIGLNMAPIIFRGLPNQVFRLEGVANWGTGTIPADSIEFMEGGKTVCGAAHSAITVSADTFPPTFVRLDGPQSAGTDGIKIYVPSKGTDKTFDVPSVKRTVELCPVSSGGEAGFSATLTGYGFSAMAWIPADSITIGGVAATHSAVSVESPSGRLPPLVLTVPALPYGEKDLVVNDGADRTFAGMLAVGRTIGLSYVCGSGQAGETTGVSGNGFTASSSIAANSITFAGAATTHPLITVAADGSFAASTLTLPLLDGGAKDVSAQEVFPQAYRVYNPQLDISKYRDPPSGVTGTVVTFSFSFTNTGFVASPRAFAVVLHDSIPAGMQYVAASVTSSLPATIDYWYADDWQSSEPVPATDVERIRWTLTSPLPAGASGYAGFQVTVQ